MAICADSFLPPQFVCLQNKQAHKHNISDNQNAKNVFLRYEHTKTIHSFNGTLLYILYIYWIHKIYESTSQLTTGFDLCKESLLCFVSILSTLIDIEYTTDFVCFFFFVVVVCYQCDWIRNLFIHF